MKPDLIKPYLRKAVLSDAKLIYNWATDPSVRENSLNKDQFSYDSHLKWFSKKIADTDCIFYILEQNEPIGQIRLDKTDQGWLINFSIGNDFRGKGFGFTIIEMAIEETGDNTYIAYVKDENIPSVKIFSKAGFKEIPSDIANTKKFIRYAG